MPFDSEFPPVADLLLALTENLPAGDDLRLDVTPQSLYFRLRDARSEARAEERLADNDPTLPDSGSRHWKTVRQLAVEALSTRTKDMEIAAWLIESLVRSDGPAGLAAGARLLRGLVEGFWNDGLFPLADPDDGEARVAAVAGLNGQDGKGTLLQPLRKVVLFETATGEPVRFWQFEQAEAAAGIADTTRRNQRLASGVAPLADLEADARGAGRPMLERLGQDVVQAMTAWQELETALATMAGDTAPSMRRVHDLLDQMRRIAERYAGPIGVVATGSPDAGHDPQAAPDEASPRGTTTGAGYDRERLLGEITRIAKVFAAHEPNSPLSYTLDDAVRRARLGWPELLREMMPDAGPRSALLSSLGIRPFAE